MSESCVPVEELGRLAALPVGHPERHHVEACTRCQALLVMLRAFEQPSPGPERAAFEAADPKLRAAIEDLVGSASEAPLARVRRARDADDARRRRGWTWAPARWGWAFALVVVIAGAGTMAWRAQLPGSTMRSAPSSTTAGATFASESSTPAGGAVELRWAQVSGATSYRVVLYDAALREIAALAPGRSTSLRLTADSLPAGLAHGALAGWQVEALAGGDPIARSATRGLRVP
jgi:hypothetical protein